VKRLWALRVTMAIVGAVFLCAQMCAELMVRQCRRACEAELPVGQQPHTFLSLFIGRLESLAGDVLLLKADNYFHGQTSLLGRTRVGECAHSLGPGGHEHDDACHHEHACHDGPGHDDHDHHHTADAEHDDHPEHEPGLSYDHFLYRQYAKIASTAHVHLGQHEEIVPWLYASVRLNPGNERAAVVTAYWLAQQLDRPAAAERVLRAALGERPSSWRLHAELGWLHYRLGRYGPALQQCTSALGFFEPDDDEQQARLDLAELWRLASACQEALGDLERAVACAEEVVRLLPDSEAARTRLEHLRARLDASAETEGGASASPGDSH